MDEGHRTPDLTARPTRSLRTLVPITAWLPAYKWGKDLSADLLAGVAVAALSASLVADLGGDIDPVVATAGLAVAAGVVAMVAGTLRLGWIVNFISRPVLHAFVAGLSISIIVGQADALVGVEADGESALGKAWATVSAVGDWHWLTVGIGLGSLVALLALERLVPKFPAAVIVVIVVIVVIGAILVAIAFDLNRRGVSIVGDIPSGLPKVAVPDVSAVGWAKLLGGGLALVLVGFSEGYTSARAVADQTGEDVDPDQELIGSGAGNVAAGLLGGMAVSGSLSKSSAAQNAGARTQMTNLVAGILVFATLLFLAPVLKNLPEPALVAIVIVAVLRAANPRRVLLLWQVNRIDFAAGLMTFVLVLVWESLPALIVGVSLSLTFLVRRVSFPDVVELATDGTRVLSRTESTSSTSADEPIDVAVLRFPAPLIYANADRFRSAVASLYEQRNRPSRLVLDAEMLSDLDSSGAEILEMVDDDLAKTGCELHLARVHDRTRAQIQRSELAERFDGRIHPSVAEAACPS